MTTSLCRTTIETPIGPMVAVASDRALCALEFTSLMSARAPRSTQTAAHRKNDRLTRLLARLERWFTPFSIDDRSNVVIERTRAWLHSYFNGTSAAIDALALDLRGAPFELRVWERLQEIPAGATSTYGAIAREFGSLGASRAVGLANGANPIAIIVPCHRVIGSNGTLTGYGGGLDRKQWLLEHERRSQDSTQLRLELDFSGRT